MPRTAPGAAPAPRGWRRLSSAAVVLGVLLTGGGLALAHAGSAPLADVGSVPGLAAPATTAGAPPPAAPSADPSPPARTRQQGGRPAVGAPFVPARLGIPALGVDVPVVPTGLAADGLLAVPGDVRVVGWWAGGAPAGAGRGSLALVGHVDSARQGAGSLFGLRRLPLGARVTLTGDGADRAAYRVVARRHYPKDALPLAEVFGAAGPARLVLVTCGGAFDRATGHYADNVVVYAVPAPDVATSR